MSKDNNLHDYLSDLADAIREKKGTTEPINAQSFAEEIRTIESGGSGWTGHADVEGLKAIGWDDEDIAYYQRYGVNWNEEDDEYHKVSDDNKALYGVLTASNISTYKDRIVYLPKIDTSAKTSMDNVFEGCKNMVAIPMLDTRNVTTFSSAFRNCYDLVTIPLLDTSNVTTMYNMFSSCFALSHVPLLNTKNVTHMGDMFYYCYRLTSIPVFEAWEKGQLTNIAAMFRNNYSLRHLPLLDAKNISSLDGTFVSCFALSYLKIKNLRATIHIENVSSLSKESLLYTINNEAATKAITITLSSSAYRRFAEDADIVAALANHPLISIARA